MHSTPSPTQNWNLFIFPKHLSYTVTVKNQTSVRTNWVFHVAWTLGCQVPWRYCKLLPAQKVEQKSSIVRWNGKYHWNSESKFRSSLISQIVNLKAKTITQHSHGEGFLWNHMTAVCYHDGPLSASHSRSITLVTYRYLLSFDCLQFVADNG